MSARTRISVEEVRHVARLARIEIAEGELEGYRAQLDAILGYMAELDRIDVAGVEPTYHAVAIRAPLRDDRVRPSLPRDEVLAAAPQVEDGGFAVPRVLDT